jgi:hypothetical protein
LSFSDLAQAAGGTGLRVSDVLEWTVRAEEGGLIEALGFEPSGDRSLGARHFRLTPIGLRIAVDDRRRGIDRRAA